MRRPQSSSESCDITRCREKRHEEEGGRKEDNKEGRGVDDWTTTRIHDEKCRGGRVMTRGGRMKDCLVKGAIF